MQPVNPSGIKRIRPVLCLAAQQRHAPYIYSARKASRKSDRHKCRNHRIAHPKSKWRFFGRSRLNPPEVGFGTSSIIPRRNNLRLRRRFFVPDFSGMPAKNRTHKRRILFVLRRERLLLQSKAKRLYPRMGYRQRHHARHRLFDRK